jgi:hypothetical protein
MDTLGPVPGGMLTRDYSCDYFAYTHAMLYYGSKFHYRDNTQGY